MKTDKLGRFVKQPIPDRFWPKVNKSGPIPKHRPELGPCWLWTGSTNFYGYGLLHSGDKHLGRAHRISWNIHFGDIPAEHLVLHKCDNPPCVNPKHLFLGTHQDNVADKVAKNRQPKGESNGMAKFDRDQIRQILALRQHQMSEVKIGRQFGVGAAAIHKILTGERWKHLRLPLPDQKLCSAKTSENAWKARLSHENVRMIRLRASQGMRYKDISREMRCSESNVAMIVTRRTWKHVY